MLGYEVDKNVEIFWWNIGNVFQMYCFMFQRFFQGMCLQYFEYFDGVVIILGERIQGSIYGFKFLKLYCSLFFSYGSIIRRIL